VFPFFCFDLQLKIGGKPNFLIGILGELRGFVGEVLYRKDKKRIFLD
jgi:hypothetical protein